MSTDASTRRDVPPKATLFCPECDHRSHVDDDWNLVRTVRAVHYVCPDCRTEITVRPAPVGASGSRTRVPALWEAWGAGLRAWGRIWCRAVLPARVDG